MKRGRPFRTLGSRMRDFGRTLMRQYISPGSELPEDEAQSQGWEEPAPLGWDLPDTLDTPANDEGEAAPARPVFSNPAPDPQPVQRKPQTPQPVAPKARPQPPQQQPATPAPVQPKPAAAPQRPQPAQQSAPPPVQRKAPPTSADKPTDARLAAILNAHREREAEAAAIREQKKAANDAVVQRNVDAGGPPKRRRGSASVDYLQTTALLPTDENGESIPPSPKPTPQVAEADAPIIRKADDVAPAEIEADQADYDDQDIVDSGEGGSEISDYLPTSTPPVQRASFPADTAPNPDFAETAAAPNWPQYDDVDTALEDTEQMTFPSVDPAVPNIVQRSPEVNQAAPPRRQVQPPGNPEPGDLVMDTPEFIDPNPTTDQPIQRTTDYTGSDDFSGSSLIQPPELDYFEADDEEDTLRLASHAPPNMPMDNVSDSPRFGGSPQTERVQRQPEYTDFEADDAPQYGEQFQPDNDMPESFQSAPPANVIQPAFDDDAADYVMDDPAAFEQPHFDDGAPFEQPNFQTPNIQQSSARAEQVQRFPAPQQSAENDAAYADNESYQNDEGYQPPVDSYQSDENDQPVDFYQADETYQAPVDVSQTLQNQGMVQPDRDDTAGDYVMDDPAAFEQTDFDDGASFEQPNFQTPDIQQSSARAERVQRFPAPQIPENDAAYVDGGSYQADETYQQPVDSYQSDENDQPVDYYQNDESYQPPVDVSQTLHNPGMVQPDRDDDAGDYVMDDPAAFEQSDFDDDGASFEQPNFQTPDIQQSSARAERVQRFPAPQQPENDAAYADDGFYQADENDQPVDYYQTDETYQPSVDVSQTVQNPDIVQPDRDDDAGDYVMDDPAAFEQPNFDDGASFEQPNFQTPDIQQSASRAERVQRFPAPQQPAEDDVNYDAGDAYQADETDQQPIDVFQAMQNMGMVQPDRDDTAGDYGMDETSAFGQSGFDAPTFEQPSARAERIQRFPAPQTPENDAGYEPDEAFDADYSDDQPVDLFQAMQNMGMIQPDRDDDYSIEAFDQGRADQPSGQRNTNSVENDLLSLLDSVSINPAKTTPPNIQQSPAQSTEPDDASRPEISYPDVQRVQRAETVATGSVTTSDSQTPSEGEQAGVDIDKLARDVYSALRNRLRIERERRDKP